MNAKVIGKILLIGCSTLYYHNKIGSDANELCCNCVQVSVDSILNGMHDIFCTMMISVSEIRVSCSIFIVIQLTHFF